jgi:hypothetical protein
MKLEQPTDNPRRAFCCAACFETYFRRCCLVCERPLGPDRTARRRFCRARCRVEYNRHLERFNFPHPAQGSVSLRNAIGSAHSTGLKPGTESGRPFRIVAGPQLTTTAFRLASIPLDPELAARLARTHAGFVERRQKAQRAVARKALIKRRTWPVTIIGRRQVPDHPHIDLSPLPAPEWAIPSRWAPVGDGRDVPPIPDFLLRTPAALRPAAERETGLMPEAGPVLKVA